MRNTITRSFVTVFASCKVYESGKLLDAIVALPDFCTLVSTAEKYIRKNPSVISGKLVEVTELNKQSELYGMDEADFIAHAKPYENRSKDTRNLITKTVKGFIGEYLYMDVTSRQLATRKVSVPADMSAKLDKYAKSIEQENEKAITIENLVPVESLYGMSESDFRKYGKKMVDHQHYAE